MYICIYVYIHVYLYICILTNKSVDFLPHFGAIPHMWCGKGEFEACSSLLPDYWKKFHLAPRSIESIFSKWSNISSRISILKVKFARDWSLSHFGMFWRSPLDGFWGFWRWFPAFLFGERNSHTFFGTEVVMVSMVCFRESEPQSGSWHFQRVNKNQATKRAAVFCLCKLGVKNIEICNLQNTCSIVTTRSLVDGIVFYRVARPHRFTVSVMW